MLPAILLLLGSSLAAAADYLHVDNTTTTTTTTATAIVITITTTTDTTTTTITTTTTNTTTSTDTDPPPRHNTRVPPNCRVASYIPPPPEPPLSKVYKCRGPHGNFTSTFTTAVHTWPPARRRTGRPFADWVRASSTAATTAPGAEGSDDAAAAAAEQGRDGDGEGEDGEEVVEVIPTVVFEG